MKEMEEIKIKMDFQKKIVEKSTGLFIASMIGFAIYGILIEYNFIIGFMFFLSVFSVIQHWRAYKSVKLLETYYKDVEKRVKNEELTDREAAQKILDFTKE